MFFRHEFSKKVISIFIFSIFSFACATTSEVRPLQPADLSIVKALRDFDNKAPVLKELSAVQVKTDVSYLMYAMTSAYAGRKYHSAKLYQSVMDKLDSIESPLSPEALKDKIDSALFLLPDNHLHAEYEGKVSSERTNAKKAGQVGKNAISSPDKIWEVRIDNKNKKRILYVSITTMSQGTDPVWNGFINKVKGDLKHSDLLVLDLRGNRGGDDSKGYELSELLSGHKAVDPIQRQIYSETSESLMIYENLLRLLKRMQLKKGAKETAFLDDLIHTQEDKYELALAGKIPPERIVVKNQNHKMLKPEQIAYAKPIYILMDGECASSCESTIQAFENFPNVKKVGENTGGFLMFGNVGAILLPNSHILAEIPTFMEEYYNNDKNLERAGLSPDIRILSGEDAYLYIKNLN